MNYDGWVTIGTDLDSKEFDKEIKRLQKESEKLAKEEELLLNKKTKLEVDTSKTINELNKVDKKIELISKKMSTMEENNLPQNLEKNNAYQKMSVECDSLITKSQEYATKLESQKSSLNDINQKIIENATNQENVSGKLEETKAEAMGLHMNFDGIGKSLTGMIRKAAQWTMAIFSVRTAYNGIRQAMSMISSYNDDMNNKLYSIKMTFASALEPVITRIVDLIWKMMSYINYIAKAWFGVDLFAKASANSMKSSAKSAKDMKKSLAGFDEANVLNDNGTTGSMGGSSSPEFVMPENVEIPSWVKWIAENKDKVLDFFKQLGILILALKLAKWFGLIGNIGKVAGNLFKIVKNLFGLLKGLSGLQIFALIAGIALTITGIITAIKGVIAYIKDPSWSNFNKILEGLTLTLLGVGTVMVALNASNPVGWILIATGLASGLVTIVSSLTKKFFENKAQILDTKTAQEQLTQAQESAKKAQEDLMNATNNYINAVDRAEEAEKKLIEAEKLHGISGEELQKQVDNGTLSYQTMDSTQREVYKAYLNNIQAQDNLKKSTEEVTNAQHSKIEADKEAIRKGLELELSNGAQSKSFEKFRDAVVDAYEKGEISADEARNYIERAMADMSDASRKTFQESLPNDIKKGLDPNRYQSEARNFTSFMNGLWENIKQTASKAWNTITGWFSKGVSVPVSVETSGNFRQASSYHAKGAIMYPKLQYHANGGIINQPGRGVPITQHIGGERGAEGIIPLTDSQQMDLLGQSITKYMTINLTNINQLNGRLISRELTKIKAQQDFASNR